MGGGEGLACQVCYPVTEIVVTRRDKAAVFAVKGVTEGEFDLVSIVVCCEVRGIEAILKEEGVTPLLCPQLSPIECG